MDISEKFYKTLIQTSARESFFVKLQAYPSHRYFPGIFFDIFRKRDGCLEHICSAASALSYY